MAGDSCNDRSSSSCRRRRSKRYIGLSMFSLSISMTALILFSQRLALGTAPNALNIAVVAVANLLVGASVAALRYSYIMRATEDAARSIDAEKAADADFVKSLTGLPRRYTYEEVERMTGGFKWRLGRGGSGSVYEGKLPDGAKVAVKRLEGRGQEATGGDVRQFYAEVATISKVKHANLVNLQGFCAEADHKMLVYEYMEKGSLDKWIFKGGDGYGDGGGRTSTQLLYLGWTERYNIAVGTAKALAYLHHECDDTILHLDVKPQNVLLADDFSPKVSDFGLSRSIGKGESRVVTVTVRGTPGYLAPEWFAGDDDVGIGEKADVYSYGILLLELFTGRRSFDRSVPESAAFLPDLAWKTLQLQNGGSGGTAEVLLDPRLRTAGTTGPSAESTAMVFGVALWCVQEDAQSRPTMAGVVKMLEGQSPVPSPPPPIRSPFLVNMHRLPRLPSSELSAAAMSGAAGHDIITVVVGR